MLPVLPLDVSVAYFLEAVGLEARGKSKFTKPRDNRDVHAIRRGIANHETHPRRRVTDWAQNLPNARHVTEVTGDHQVVGLSPTS